MTPAHSSKYCAARADLGGGTALFSLAGDEVDVLAAEFAAMEPWLRYSTNCAVLRDFMTRHEPGVLKGVLRQDGRTAGFGVVRIDWLRGPYVQFLGVLSEFQGGGIGGRFLVWLENEAAREGHRHVWIMVSVFNDRARAFYQRQGYTEIASIPDIIKDGFEEILLRKRL